MHDDPFSVLGISPSAGDDEVRRAWLEGVRRHPPEQDPENFQRIRSAYEAIKDEVSRVHFRLFTIVPLEAHDVMMQFPNQILRAPSGEFFDVLSEGER